MEEKKSESLVVSEAKDDPLLGVLRCELTQSAIDLAIQELNLSYTTEKYVEQQRGAFFIKVGGPVTLSDLSLQIAGGRGVPNVRITNEFKLYVRIPIIGERHFESLPFQISAPSIRVSLHAEGSKGFATLYFDTLKIEMLQGMLSGLLPSGVLREVLNLVKQSIRLIVDELTYALNDKLRREPFQLFDLSHTKVPIGDDKMLHTRVVLDELGFSGDRIIAQLRMFGLDQPLR